MPFLHDPAQVPGPSVGWMRKPGSACEKLAIPRFPMAHDEEGRKVEEVCAWRGWGWGTWKALPAGPAHWNLLLLVVGGGP